MHTLAPSPLRQTGADLVLAAVLTPLLAAAALAGLILFVFRDRVFGPGACKPAAGAAAGGARAAKDAAAAAKREPPGLASKDVTLVLTDVQVRVRRSVELQGVGAGVSGVGGGRPQRLRAGPASPMPGFYS